MDKHLSLERLKGKEEKPDLKNIFENFAKNVEEYKSENKNVNIEEALKEKLNNGTSTEHYWFYKLEYLLWKNSNEYFDKEKLKNEGGKPFDESDKFKYSKIKENYRLTRKNSIEHIQPRSKADGEKWLFKEEEKQKCEENKCHIDCFGNLALISNYLNSALLDKSFENKRLKIQEQLNNGTIESLKILLIYSKYNEWTPEKCKEHYDNMLNGSVYITV